ncbi:MAG: 50S ribosomal protein L25/general stress protein Ctc [Sulfurospirillum sp.]|nr:50S ribosomal protein L25/general stress protein Ctc [Sulfurospirillum sp.]MBL0702476.1 50S ribosomal protein L25/general stress protein Ctc [Sulfurospirillum sp.]
MLEGIIRESIDKKATKALRKDGFLIANIYGKGVDNVNAAFKSNDFIRAMKSKKSLSFLVKVAKIEYKVVVQDYQKDPVTSILLHVDLRIVLDGVLSKYLIPVKTKGTPIGLKNRGILINSKKRLLVKCLGENLPDCFTLDVSHLDVDDSILIRDMDVPANVKIMEEDRVSITGVIKAK